ncbi:MAG: 4Fe-4S binding protein [Deltaproteobacteria bacterium]|nr:4Fe-4S binding protein [Deltaproteobacteria bacterium]MBW2139237.1 4Fe-4S binding protein [Deltaproteobacteria bacterium]
MAIESIEGCNGCKMCFYVCPMDVIRINDDSGLAEIRYPEDCQACNLCAVFCPVEAIVVTKDRFSPLMTAWG